MRRFVRAMSTPALVPSEESDASLLEAVSRGSVPAFEELFTRTSGPVRAVLATLAVDAGQVAEILAASYVEVWWLAGCHTEPGVDAVGWITGIARRRAAEAGNAPAQASPYGYARLELAALLRHPVGISSQAGQVWQVGDDQAGDVGEPPVVVAGVGADVPERVVDGDVLDLGEGAFCLFDDDSAVEGSL